MPGPYTIPFAPRQSGYPSRISDLIRNQGEIAAQRAERSGQIWNNTLLGIANGLANIPRIMAETEERKARAEQYRQATEDRKARAATEERQAKETAALHDLFSTNPSPSPQDIYGIVGPERGLKIVEGLSTLQKNNLTEQDTHASILQKRLAGLDALPPEARAQYYPAIRERSIADGLIRPEDAPEQFDPVWWLQARAYGQKQDTQDFTLGPGQTRYGPDGKVIAQAPASEPKGVNLQHVDTAQGIRAFDPTTGQMGPVIAQGKPPADANNRIWITRTSPDGTRQTLRVSESEIRPGDAPASTREQGRKVTSGDAEDLATIKDSQQDLKVLRESIGKTGAGSWMGTKVPDVVTSVTGIGAESKSRQATIDRVKQVIGKALEGGVLRKEDEIKYEKILPKIGDAPEVVKAKLDGLDAAIKRKMRNRLDSLADAGYDVSAYEKRQEKRRLSTDPNDPNVVISK